MPVRRLLLVVCALLTLLVSPALLAQQRQRVVVEQFTGVGPLIVRPGAVQALEGRPGIEVAPVKSLGPEGRLTDGSPRAYAEAARRLRLTAFISGKVEQLGPSRFAVSIVIRDASGQAIGNYSYQSQWVAGVRNEVRKRLWNDLRPLLEDNASTRPAVAPPQRAAPAPEHIVLEEEPEEPSGPAAAEQSAGARPEGEPAAPRPPERAAPSDPEKVTPPPGVRGPGAGTRRWPSTLEFELSGGVTFRDYKYKAEYLGPLREYHLLRAPFGGASLTWFPAAVATKKWPAHVGLTGSLDQMFPITSRVSGQRLSTQAGGYSAGLTGRFPGSVLELRPSLVYGAQTFTVEREYVPDAEYRFLRPALALRLGLFRWRWSWSASAGFRWVLSAGELEQVPWFPGARGIGVDAGLETAVRIVPWLELGARGRHRLHRFSLNPVRGGAYTNGVAEVAVDRATDVSLLLRLLLGRAR